jgi:anti-anti-sigma factor
MQREPESPFEVSSDARGSDVTVVTARGEIDQGTAPLLERRLLEAVDRSVPVVVDLSAVSYIDSSGFRILHRTAIQCAVVVVVPPGAPTLRAIQLAGLAETVPTFPDLERARDALRRPRP